MVDAEERSKEPLDGAPARAARGQKLWAVLLVFDSFFVIIFGGALAAKLYQHWQGPPPTATRRPRPVTKPATPPAEAAKNEPKPEAKSPEPPKPEPAKPAAKESAPAANSPRPPKPSLLHEAPKREAAKPQGSAPVAAAPAAAAPATAAGVQKAVPTEFHYKGSAKRVELVGAFIVRGGRKSMVESAPGNWTLTLYLTPNTYRYHFFVNGKKQLDPDNAKQDRGMSVLTVAPAQP